MPTYSTPGVYVNEGTLASLTPSFSGGTSAVFFGEAERGPTTVTSISDWATYKRVYGDLKDAYDIGYAVYHYFANGGRNCYVVRIAASDAVTSSATDVVYYPRGSAGSNVTATSASVGLTSNVATIHTDSAHTFVVGDVVSVTGATNSVFNVTDKTITAVTSTSFSFALTNADIALVEDTGATATVTAASRIVKLFDVDAVSDGTWGNSLNVKFENGNVSYANGTHGTFNLVVLDGTREIERWTEVTLDPDANRYVGTVVNTYSNYIRLSNVSTHPALSANSFDTSSTFDLSGGSNGSAIADSDYTTAVDLLDPIEGTLLLNAVGNTSGTVITALVNKAANRGDSFVIIDPSKADDTLSDIQTTAANFSNQSNGGYAAHYAPALVMVDPAKTGPGALRTTFPGGAIAGLMVRTETQRSVAKAPAGYDADIRGAIGLVANLSNADIGTLYDGNTPINAFKAVPGGGVVVYGARTLSRVATDKFIPVRRTLNHLKYNLKKITEFAVFQPNDPNLWSRINLVVSSFLGEFYRSGGLRGSNASQSFYVLCDSTNNTTVSIDQGIVNVEVGVALQYPAEFIVINLSQWTGGGNAVESL